MSLEAPYFETEPNIGSVCGECGRSFVKQAIFFLFGRFEAESSVYDILATSLMFSVNALEYFGSFIEFGFNILCKSSKKFCSLRSHVQVVSICFYFILHK